MQWGSIGNSERFLGRIGTIPVPPGIMTFSNVSLVFASVGDWSSFWPMKTSGLTSVEPYLRDFWHPTRPAIWIPKRSIQGRSVAMSERFWGHSAALPERFSGLSAAPWERFSDVKVYIGDNI